MKIVGIIQARLGSTRLPYKMLLSLHGRPIIEWVIKRVQRSKLLDEIILALPDTKEDNLLELYCKKYGAKVYRGSEEDVLSRFYFAAKETKASHIVRICADNPLISPEEIDNLIRFYKKNECDYAYNHIPKNNNYPDGLGAEMVSMELLELLNNNANNQRNREHVFTYITDHPELFVIKTFNPPDKNLHHPELKLDIDTFDDYLFLHSRNYNQKVDNEDIINKFSNNNTNL